MKKAMLTACVAGFLMLTACSTAPRTAAGKTNIRAEAEAALASAKNNNPTLTPIIDDAAGYAVFPSVGKGAVGIGGAYGKGVLYEGGEFAGYCDLTQASIGFQFGGQAYTELITFATDIAVARFKTGSLTFDAQATAVALKAGAGANAAYSNDVAVFTMGEAGLMYEASIGGQKFSYQPK